MKKQLFIAIALLACCLPAGKISAQSAFAPVGAEWWYSNSYTFDSNGYYNQLKHVQSISDTIITGISCSKLITTAYRRYGEETPSESPDTTFFVYSNPDTVFVFNNIFNRFTPLYVFNVNIGDTICLPVPPYSNDLRMNPYSGDTSFCFTIDTILLRQYDTVTLKTYFTQSIASFEENHFIGDYPCFTYGGHNLIYGDGVYTEVIGGNYGLLPIQKIQVFDSSVIPIGPSGNMHCYSDSSINITKIDGSWWPCDTLPPVQFGEVNNIEKSPINLYPNPATNSFTLSADIPFPAVATASLSDMYGRCIKWFSAIPKGATTITYDISGIAPGMYFLKIQSARAAIQKKLVITR